jgi:hypothetical protein
MNLTVVFWAMMALGLGGLGAVYWSEVVAERLYGELDEETVRRLLDAQRVMVRARRRKEKESPAAVRAATGLNARGRAGRRIGLGGWLGRYVARMGIGKMGMHEVGPYRDEYEQREAEMQEQVEAADQADAQHAIYRGIRGRHAEDPTCERCRQRIDVAEEAALVNGQLVHAHNCLDEAIRQMGRIAQRRGLGALRHFRVGGLAR